MEDRIQLSDVEASFARHVIADIILTDSQKSMREETNMASIKQMAENYVAPETKNIAELQKVSVELDVQEVEYTIKEGPDTGKKFTVNEVEIDGEKYRVPNSVLKSLKAMMEEIKDLQFFKVRKEGSGLNTTYTVIPLRE